MFLNLFWKRGERQQMWVNRLKIAIIEKNTDTINALLDEMPEFNGVDDLKEIDEVMALLQEAFALVQGLKDETAISMRQMKQNLSFLKSTRVDKSNGFDVTF